MRGELTLREIQDQPAAWTAALERYDHQAPRVAALFGAHPPSEVVFTGCGSSYHLSLTAACVWQQVTGRRVRAVPASEILQFPESVFAPDARPLVVAASRSGTTTETLRAARLLARRRIPVIALTCAARSPLAAMAAVALVSPEGRERSVVMTKSFSSMLLLSLAMGAAVGDDRALQQQLRRLPALGRRALKVAVPLTRDLGVDASWVVFLGAGPSHGVAWEAMLKLTEMAQRKAVAYHPLEYRHGPIALAGPGMLAVLFGTDRGAGLEKTLVRDLARLGTHVVALSGGDARRTDAEIEVLLADGLSDAARSVLYLPFAQLLAYHRAVGIGLDPDRPHHLTAVVEL